MKRFLKNIVLCGIPLLLFLIVVEVVVRSAPNDYKYKWSYLEEHASDIEVLVLGNSHTANGIDCWILPNSFNMAMGGQGIMMDGFILSRFIGKMPKLKLVIIPMTYPSLIMPESFGTPDRYMQYNIYYHYNPKWYSKESYECLNFLSCSKKIRSLLKGNCLVTTDSLGCYKASGNGFYDISDETLSWMSGRNPNMEKINREHLEKIVGLCEERGVKVILVSIPVDTTFRENKLFNKEQMDLVKNVSRIMSEEHDDVYWIDWYDNPDFSKSDFFNSDHLNEHGAVKLTNRLMQFMIEKDIVDGGGL